MSENKAGKIAAGVTVVVFLVGGFFMIRAVLDIQSRFPLEIVEVSETFDPESCTWTLEVTMRNDSTEQVEVTRIGTVLNRRRASRVIEQAPLAVGETAIATVSWNALAASVCPSSVDDVNHTKLSVELDNGATVIYGF